VGISGGQGKSFEIDKRLIWEAWKRVKKNQGAPGIDGLTVGQFEERLEANLYKLWNRMSSGTYFRRL
jgi:retron-type reverse transcriptase